MSESTEKTITRTYRLRMETVDAIDEAVGRLGVHQSHLVELLIRDGLRRMETGELQIKRRAVAWELYL